MRSLTYLLVVGMLMLPPCGFCKAKAPNDAKLWRVYNGKVPTQANAIRFGIEACIEPLQRRKVPSSKKQWESKSKVLRRKLAIALGLFPLPPRTLLNACITGKAKREAYTIENIVYESRPGFYVTANLYIPRKAARPMPAVVVTAGHAYKYSKNAEGYQMAQLGLVHQGFAVLAFDPIGQGERRLPGFDHPQGYSLLMVGQTNEGIIIWDAMRGIDYLCSRPDIDSSRIGIAGNSGGGTAAFYTHAIDTRIKAAGSFSFVCSYKLWIEFGGSHCICNHLPNIVHEMEEFEVAGLCAPRPLMFGNGSNDKIFPIQGTRDTFNRAQSIYEFYGAADRLAMIEVPEPHGWSQGLREGCRGWMAYWLGDVIASSPITENTFQSENPDSPDLQCFKGKGMPAGAETLVTLTTKWGQEYIEGYNKPPTNKRQCQKREEELREQIWENFGGKPQAKAKARKMGSFAYKKHRVERLALTTEPGMEIPALLLWPEKRAKTCPVVVYINEKGKHQVRNWELTDQLLDKGIAICAIDPRGTGEIKVNERHFVNNGVVLGRSLLAQQTWDAIAAAHCLSKMDGINAHSIAIYGKGAAAPIALFATALDDVYCGLATEGAFASYLNIVENKRRWPLWTYPTNILKTADIPQVLSLVAPRPVLMSNTVGYERKTLSKQDTTNALRYASSVYELTTNPNDLTTTTGTSEETFEFYRNLLQ
jgi:cephalosporin-C deacetylase-like acetyl esterase